MKTLFFKLLISLFLLASIQTYGQFKAKMVFDTMNKERMFTVYSADDGYRYEFNEDGQEGVVIVKNDSHEVIILMPQQKMAMRSPAESPMSMGNDPLKSYEYYGNDNILKEVGTENVNGIDCIKSILWNKNNPSQKMFTIWYSEKYKFPIKLVNHIDGSEESGMELKDVEPWTPNPDSFEIPQEYQIMELPVMIP